MAFRCLCDALYSLEFRFFWDTLYIKLYYQQEHSCNPYQWMPIYTLSMASIETFLKNTMHQHPSTLEFSVVEMNGKIQLYLGDWLVNTFDLLGQYHKCLFLPFASSAISSIFPFVHRKIAYQDDPGKIFMQSLIKEVSWKRVMLFGYTPFLVSRSPSFSSR